MNKAELVQAIVEKTGLSKKDADMAVKAFTETVIEEVAAGGNVQLVGFGTFMQSERAARQGRNPQSGESIRIPATKVPKFKAGRLFKNAM